MTNDGCNAHASFAGEQMAKGHKDKVAVITGQTMNVDGGRVRT
jgi:hypothetical protein